MPVTIDRVRRMGGAAGLVFIVLGLVSIFLPGTPPKADEVANVSRFLTDERGSILAANFLVCLGFAFFLLFAGALRAHLGAAAPEVRPGSALLAAGATAAGLVIAGAAVLNGAAFQVASAGDVNLNLALYHVANDLFFAAGFAFAAFFAGAAIAIMVTGALPAPLAPLGALAALLNAVGGVGFFAKSGFFAIGGAFGIIVPLVSVSWVLWASVALLRPAPVARTAT